MQAGRTYYYKVQSVGRTHRSELSSQVGAEALADEVSPGVPRNVSAVAEAGFPDRITVRWSAPTTDADGGELTGLSGFTVYRSEGVPGSLVAVASLGAEAREYVDEGLRSLTEYGYAVSAFDAGGNESAQSSVSRARTEGIAVPSGVRARDGIGRIEVSWESVGDEELIGYNVYRSPRPDLEFERLASGSGAPYTTGRTSYVDSNLTAGERFYYKVSSLSPGFESELSGYVSGESQADVVAPEPPGGLVATALEAGSGIRLSWRAPRYDADGGELTGLEGYVIFRSSSGLSERAAVDTVSAAVTEYVDEGLESAVVYTYALMAVDGSGNGSELTAPVSATARGLAPPSGLSAVSGIGRVTVSWLGAMSRTWSATTCIALNVRTGTSRGCRASRARRSRRGRPLMSIPGSSGRGPFLPRERRHLQGESDLSEFEGATVESDTRPPAAPTFLSGEAVVGDPEVILLEWRAPSSDAGGAELTGLSEYLVFRAESASGPFEEIGASETAAYRDSELDQRTTYYYQVQALDPAGNASAPSATEAATTSGVDIPKNVSLSSTTPSDPARNPVVTVRWVASEGVILRYEVERTTVPNSTDDADYTEIRAASGLKNDIRTSREDDSVKRGSDLLLPGAGRRRGVA